MQVRVTSNMSAVGYNTLPSAFVVSQAGPAGPTPGQLLAAVAPGTDVNLSELTSPGGLCRIRNDDATNFVTIGIWDPSTSEYFPLLEVLPGESYVVRLSRELGLMYGAGAGTTGSGKSLRLRANAAPCRILVEAFDA